MKNYQMYIDGTWQDAESGKRFDTVEPWTENTWATMPHAEAADADKAVKAAHVAMTEGPWASMTATARGGLMRKLGDLIARDSEILAQAEVADNGKLIAEMRGQCGYLPQYYYYFGGMADKIEGTVPPIERPGTHAFTRNEPIGVVVAITPWNSPLLLVAAKIAPALAAGCSVIVKPSEHASASTLEFAKLAEEAGFPPGVINVVTGFGHEVGDALVRHPQVARITFTGGEETGRKINETAAKDFKEVDLELGGKSPNIVFDDADLDEAVNGAIAGIFGASGQSCIAGSRLLLQDSIYDAFVEKLIAIMSQVTIGNPHEATTQIGPMTTEQQYAKVLDYINIAKAEGANCVLGGDKVEGAGWFIKPTIFTDVTNDMRIAREEVFGPVLSIIRFKDEAEALRIANDTNYGLAGGIWTQNMQRSFEVSAKLQAGTVWVNTYRALSYTMPFGGFKDSGKGRENGIAAIRANFETKSVIMNYGMKVPNPFVMNLS